MIAPEAPPREAERMAALRRYRLEITGREPEFDRIARHVADLFGTPIALVSLVLDEEQRFMGACGLDITSTARDIAFCAHALAGEEVLVVPDALADPRFARNPLVTGPPHIRFYAGAPLLLAPGLVAGTLCAIGTEPREFRPVESRRLAALAEIVVDMVHHRLGTLIAREAEQRADAASRQRDEILDAMPAALAVYDENGLLLSTNRLFSETLHPGRPELVRGGMSPAEVWDSLRALGHRILAGQEEEFLQSGGSERRRVRRQAFEILLADGRTLRGEEVTTHSGLLISAKMDITDLKAREATIEAQETLLRATLEAIEHGVLVVGPDLRVALCNDRYIAITRSSPELKRPGTPVEALIEAWVHGRERTAEDPESLVQARMESMRRRESQRFELETRDGCHIQFVRSVMPDGRFLVTATDVTARREAERMKDDFVATVSHELRTPLTSIAGSLGLLVAGAGGPLNEKAGRLLEIARKNTDRLIRLINDLLDIGKMEAGKLDFAFRPVRLADALRQAAEENRPYAEQLGVALVLAPAAEAAEMEVSADPHRLQQVLSNLLSNAAKFSPRGGDVRLGLERLPDGMARISVTDHGSGIPEGFRDRIFQKFAQSDSGSKRMQEGTGLGLAISRAIVERHGGRIGFNPGPNGRGSTFHVDLPPIAPCEILVCVEDDVMAGSIDKVLRRAGLQAERVASVAAAMDRLSAPTVTRAVLLEANLLSRGGLTLVDQLRAREALREVRLLLVAVDDGKTEPGSDVIAAGALSVADWIAGSDGRRKLEPRLRATVKASRGGRESRPRILHIEDDPDLRRVVELAIGATAEIVGAADLARARELLEAGAQRFDLVILDIGLPDGSGLDLLPLLRLPDGLAIEVVVYSAYEPDADSARGVAAVLAKSRVSVIELAETVKRLVGPRDREAET